MTRALVSASVLVTVLGVVGSVLTDNPLYGVMPIGLAGVLAVFARIAQAAQHHKQHTRE